MAQMTPAVGPQPDGTLAVPALPEPLVDRLSSIRSAIDRFKTAKARWLVAEQDPASSQARRDSMRSELEGEIHNFRYQWENVDAILIAMLPAVEAHD